MGLELELQHNEDGTAVLGLALLELVRSYQEEEAEDHHHQTCLHLLYHRHDLPKTLEPAPRLRAEADQTEVLLLHHCWT